MAGQRDAAERRGHREATQLREDLELYRTAPLFTDVNPLDDLPADNQVLQRQAGYRDVYRAFFQAEAATMLQWDGGDDVFAAGQRDVATLYEYWVYLELARIIGDLDDITLDRRELLKVTDHQMSLDLRKGTGRRLIGYGTRRGRRLKLELWFNKTFGPGSGSWSESLRPDCSIRITPEDGIADDSSTWLHFDAKYRIDRYTELFTAADTADQEDEDDEVGAVADVRVEDVVAATSRSSRPPADTILKMHAYRDAIQRSSGAYVLYPGTDEEPLQRAEYHEVLPGVGAFVLRPTEDGHAAAGSVSLLRTFLEDVLDHVAAEGTSQDAPTTGPRRHTAARMPSALRRSLRCSGRRPTRSYCWAT